jgi:2,4-dienoyl-CoA reductase [(3E)-enoyl-CoA-producing], peroxisomal
MCWNVCLEEGPRGITSNVISPGPIADTEGMQRLSAGRSEEESAMGIPSGRWGRVKEIADATVFLFSDAGNYVNGEILVVDGGSWHSRIQPGADWAYPKFLLSDQEVSGVKGSKGSKL